jgi:hypothetical protein
MSTSSSSTTSLQVTDTKENSCDDVVILQCKNYTSYLHGLQDDDLKLVEQLQATSTSMNMSPSLSVKAVAWDDTTYDWKRARLIVIRSVWNLLCI